jgi:4-hydroxy-tetrahydrodipicolinate synthase
VISGTLAAALTPLRDGGTALDEAAFEPYLEFLADGGVDGVFALGSTGEGLLLSTAERKRAAELFRHERLSLAVHCGALTTAEAVELAGHAASIGADAVAVVAPPYYPYGPEALLAHFEAVAHACEPVSFFVYEIAARAGYAVPVSVIERLRERAPNLAGLKVSDTPMSAVAPYLLDGLAVFVGSEPLIPEALAAGAVGAVSALGAVYPDVVSGLVREPSADGAARVQELRAALDPFIPAAKRLLAGRGLMQPDVRAPLQ